MKLRRFSRPLASIIILVVCAAAAVGGVFLGAKLQSNADSRIEQSRTPIETTALIENRAYELTAAVGIVSAVQAFSFVPKAEGRAVLTSVGVGVGDVLASGHLLVTVNDVSILALRLGTVPWRDYSYGDAGSDVTALNNELIALGVRSEPTSDEYDYETVYGIKQLFEQAGAEAPGSPEGASLPLSQLAVLPPGDFTVTKVGVVGQELAVDEVAVAAQKSTVEVATVLDILQFEGVELGSAVDLSLVGGSSLGTGTVSSIGEFRPASTPTTAGESATASGYPATVAFQSEGSATLKGGEQVLIAFPANAPEAPAVPTLALNQTGSRVWVRIKSGGDYHDVTVVPQWQQGGWTGIQTTDDLAAGDTVVTSTTVPSEPGG